MHVMSSSVAQSDLEQLKEHNYVSRPTFEATPIVRHTHITVQNDTRVGLFMSGIEACEINILLVASYIFRIPEYISCYIIGGLENIAFSNEVLKARFVFMFSKHGKGY